MVRKRRKSQSDPIISRLHRIIGQLQGVERMLKDGKEEKDVVMLIDATVNSLRSLRNTFIRNSIHGKLTAELETLLSLVDK